MVQNVLALEREFEDSRASSKKVEVRPANLGKGAGKRPMVESQGPSKRRVTGLCPRFRRFHGGRPCTLGMDV